MPRSLSRRDLLAGAAAGLGVAATAACSRKPKKLEDLPPPNIIVLVTDDQRWNALGCAGNGIIQTPALDSLAEQGTRFPNAFVTTSICVSSRASLLTGLYTRRHGIIDFSQQLSRPQVARSYPAILRASGYWTGFVGKHGLGGADALEPEFDFWRGFDGQGNYFEPGTGRYSHLTARLGDQCREFVDTVPRNTPFCLSVSFKAAHAVDEDPDPYQHDRRFNEYYAGRQIPWPPTATDADHFALPPFVRDGEGRRRFLQRFSDPDRAQENLRNYYRLITGVDDAVGRLLAELERTGHLRNSIVLFTSDNGYALGDRGLTDKWHPYEESIRVPMIVTDFRPLAHARRGQVQRSMALNIDVAPTVLDYARAKGPRCDGLSLMPLVAGERLDSADRTPWRNNFFYEHLFQHPGIPKSEAVRSESWKYIRWVEHDVEQLFDLRADPNEREDLVNSRRAAPYLAEMRSQWRTYRETLGDPA